MLGLSACGDDERVTELEGQLSDAQTESESLRQQLDESNTRITDLETAASEAEANPAPDAEALRGPMQSAVGALKQVDDQLVQLRQSLPVEQANMAPIDDLRARIVEAGRSMGEVAQAVGIDPASLTEAQN